MTRSAISRDLCLLLLPTMCLLGLLNGPASAEASIEFDPYGGSMELKFEATGFFRTEFDGKRWWMVTPEGGAFLSVGMNCVRPTGDGERGTGRRIYHENILEKYGSEDAWAVETEKRLREWNVNTIGNWSAQHLKGKMPYAVEVTMVPHRWASRDKTEMPDFFSPEFKAYAKERAEKTREFVDDPYMVGYFLANELPWAPDYRLGPDLFTGYVAMAPDAPGKQRVMAFFEERYENPQAFSEVWRPAIGSWDELAGISELKPLRKRQAHRDCEAFTEIVAGEFFKTATEAIHAVDPNHITLGCRFIWQVVPRAVVKACGQYCDVVSINFYETGQLGKVMLWFLDTVVDRCEDNDGRFDGFYEAAQKPLMVTEFSFRSQDSGMPNTYPPSMAVQPVVPNQKARAEKYRHYITTWAGTPFFVGWHWFQYMDQPKAGRGDGENGNYGIVNIKDDPYEEFVRVFTETNREAWDIHRKAGE